MCLERPHWGYILAISLYSSFAGIYQLVWGYLFGNTMITTVNYLFYAGGVLNLLCAGLIWVHRKQNKLKPHEIRSKYKHCAINAGRFMTTFFFFWVACGIHIAILCCVLLSYPFIILFCVVEFAVGLAAEYWEMSFNTFL